MPKYPAIKNWEDADLALNCIGLIQNRRQTREADARAKIEAIKSSLQEMIGPDQEKEKSVVKALEKFVKANQKDLQGRSLKLAWGTVGFRLTPPKLKVRNVSTTLAKLRELGGKFKRFIRVKEELDKDALEVLGDDDLKALGVTRAQADRFFAEPDLEKIMNEAG